MRPGGLRLVLLVALGLGVHLWFVAAASALDSDQSLVLLMAQAFAQGRPTVYFWSQNYMAALEPLLLTPFALAGWGSPTAAALVALGLTAILAALSVAMSRRLGGLPWVVLLLWAVPPAVVVHHHVALYGARLAATVLMVLAFWWGMRAASPRTWVAIGILSGAAYFGDHLMLPWAAGVVWLALAQRQLGRFALGALPLVAIDTALAMATPAAHLAGPTRVESWLATAPHLATVVIPQLLGLLPANGPGPIGEPAGVVVPPLWPWLIFAIPGALALVGVLRTLVRRGAALGADQRVQALLLVTVAQLALFLVVVWVVTVTAAIGVFFPAGQVIASELLGNISSPAQIFQITVFFAMSYLTVGAFFLAAGSAANSISDAQAVVAPATLVTMPICMLPLVVAYAPESAFARFASYVPFFAPFTMMVRSLSSPEGIDILGSFVVSALTLWWLIRLVARVFRANLLRPDAPASFSGFLRDLFSPPRRI